MESKQNASLPQPGAPAPVPTQPEPTRQPTAAATPTNNAPAIANDNDLIEKEWVAQVKHVLETNAGNPYQQNRQLAALRADYMQKRYGKDTTLSE